MPKRDSAPVGAPCWVDLFTSDPDRSRAFYGEIFGWTSESAGEEYGGYINFSKNDVRVAGCMHNDGSIGAPDGWSIYLACTNAAATADAAAAHGGAVQYPPMQVMELGTMAYVFDPGGARIGLWQPGEFPGFGIYDEIGSASWFELHTTAYDASVAFYRDAFGWNAQTVSDSPEFRYTTLNEGEEQLAGIMDASSFLPAGAPGAWTVYFATANADATLAQVVSLGGAIVDSAEDTPYGRLATATDPTGARFKLRQTL